jgi:hypothetical protein
VTTEETLKLVLVEAKRANEIALREFGVGLIDLNVITAIEQALALDKKAENARELGLDYEPVFSYTPDMDAVRRAEKEKADKFLGKYLAQPAPVQEPEYKFCDDGKVILKNPEMLFQRYRDATPPAAPVQEPIEFGMNGEKMMFKVGVQQFTLDYEPDTQDEFNFMRDMLIHAFSTFTPDVKTTPPAAKRQWTGLTDEETDTEATQHEQSHGFIQGVQWANTKLKEKNNG